MNVSEEMKQNAINMANVIYQSIFWSVKAPVVLSWGVSQKSATHFNNMPALKMVVNGHIHKGEVIICYDEGRDVFEVYLLDKQGNILKKINEVFADELGKVIDENIEKPLTMSDEEYKNKSIMAAINA